MSQPASCRRRGRVLVRAIIFLIVFGLVLLAATQLYLLPALRASQTADERQLRQLQATAMLVLAVVLFVLFAGLILTFRVGRFFFPKPPAKRAKPTVYTDAWAEAGRRASAPAKTSDDDELQS